MLVYICVYIVTESVVLLSSPVCVCVCAQSGHRRALHFRPLTSTPVQWTVVVHRRTDHTHIDYLRHSLQRIHRPLVPPSPPPHLLLCSHVRPAAARSSQWQR